MNRKQFLGLVSAAALSMVLPSSAQSKTRTKVVKLAISGMS